jgi:hypothetical protein
LILPELAALQIEKLAMVKMKDARVTLYKLFEHKYIYLQELPKNAERKYSYYLFEVNTAEVLRVILGDTFKVRWNSDNTSALDLLNSLSRRPC